MVVIIVIINVVTEPGSGIFASLLWPRPRSCHQYLYLDRQSRLSCQLHLPHLTPVQPDNNSAPTP